MSIEIKIIAEQIQRTFVPLSEIKVEEKQFRCPGSGNIEIGQETNGPSTGIKFILYESKHNGEEFQIQPTDVEDFNGCRYYDTQNGQCTSPKRSRDWCEVPRTDSIENARRGVNNLYREINRGQETENKK